MTDAAYLELVAAFEQALEATRRSLVIARELADAHHDGRRLPDATVAAYRNGLARDEDTLQQFRGKVAQFKGWFKTHEARNVW